MAEHTLAGGDLAVHAVTLTADTEDVVTLAESDAYTVLVHPGTAEPVYVALKTVSVGHADSRVLFPGYALELGELDGGTELHLISEEAASYSIERA